MTDRISIHGLTVDTIIGVHDWERGRKQQIRIDLTLRVNVIHAARTDLVANTVSYGDVARLISDLAEASSYNLIEALAEAISAAVLSTFKIESLVLTVHKPGAVANADSVSVTIERSSA